MVQTYQSPVRVYKYPFELVMAAYERRFPTCKMIPVFIGCDIVREETSRDGAVHVVERKCKISAEVPYLLKKVIGADFVYFIQKNTLDRQRRTLSIEAYNLSFASRVSIQENCLYYVNEERPDWTCFEQSASLDAKSFFGFESLVERIAVRHYAANIQKGKEIIEYFVQQLAAEGITYIPPFAPSPLSSSEFAAECSSEPENGDTATRNEVMERRSSVKRTEHAGSSRLEADYIKRFLGVLEPLEESRLCELRYSLSNIHQGKLPNDAHLLRFLRACDFDSVKAREMVMNSMIWRKQHNIDKILSTYKEPAILSDYFPGVWNHFDKEGRPIYVLRFGMIDIKGLFKAVGEEDIVKFVLSLCEQGLKKASEATMKFGRPISTWMLLVDLEGLSLRHLWRPGIRTLLNIIEMVEANYPETMGLVLIVSAPRAFPILWSVVSSFINERTAQKFMVYGGNDYVHGLRAYIDEEYIPTFLQGQCCLKMSGGGLVPKSLYRVDAVERGEEDSILASLYHIGYAYKSIPLEVLIPVNDIDCVITWDFDVVKSSCLFNVYFTPKIIQPESAVQNTPSALSTLSPGGFMAASCVGGNRPVMFDRNAELGIDLFVEDKCRSCEEGSSVQGSHVCKRAGTYILQWKLPDPQHTAQLPFDFSIPLTHRCKVMYFYEVLDSCNYKGSLASIASSYSSFSSLSARTESQKSLNALDDGPPRFETSLP